MTVYSSHIVVIFALCHTFDRGDDGIYPWQGIGVWVLFVATAMTVSATWIRRFGRGPLDRVITTIAVRSSGARPESPQPSAQSVE